MAVSLLNRKYLRPSVIIFSDSEPIEGAGVDAGKWDLGLSYLYLSDDGRDQVQVKPRRIESKQRMANGRMRSYHVADKNEFSTSWSDLPSRTIGPDAKPLTSDGFSGGQDIKDWYDTHSGSFWMLLVYDASDSGVALANVVEKYNVFFDDFSFDIVKRGSTHDLWNLSMSLVEV